MQVATFLAEEWHAFIRDAWTLSELWGKTFAGRVREEMILQLATIAEKILQWVRKPVLATGHPQVHSPLVKIAEIGKVDILAFM